jgi:hypothetical protein
VAEVHPDQRWLLPATALSGPLTACGERSDQGALRRAASAACHTARHGRPFSGLAALFLAAAVVAAAVRASEPFDHGIWLIAYLFLVGFLAQLLLGLGQTALRGRAVRPAAAQTVRAQAIFWNAGGITVPLGVLANTRLPVVIGSCALLAALALFSDSLRLAPPQGPRRAASIRRAYAALLLLMAASVFVGTALAWDIPWT